MVEQSQFNITAAQKNLLKVLQNSFEIKTHPLAKCPKGIFEELFVIISHSTRLTDPLQWS